MRSVEVLPQAACKCGHPLSQVTLSVDAHEPPAAMIALVRCPRCLLTKPVPIAPNEWKFR
jgi:hypothetical protein